MGTVFKFEFLNAIKKKAFLISMGIMIAITVLFSFIPKIIASFSHKDEAKPYGIISRVDYIDEKTAAAATGLEFKTIENEEVMKEQIKEGELEAGFIYDGTTRKMFVKTTSMRDVNSRSEITAALSKLESKHDLIAEGITEEKAVELLNDQKEFETITLETDGAKNFWFAYVTSFVLYFLIMMFGQQVALAIAREKNDRTMELLITSANPSALIRGKVAAYACVGILSLVLLMAGMYIGTKLGGEQATQMLQFLNVSQLININQVIVVLSYFSLGYILYLYLLASSASLVSKLEDVNYAVQPAMMLFMISFFVSMFSLGKPGIILKVASFIPFTSPLAMPTRYSIDAVPMVEVLISLAILFATTIILRVFCIKLYRMGSLNYGTKVNFIKSFMSVFKNK